MIVAVAHEKGGSGKTTLATNLAVYLQRAAQDVLLLDADRQTSAQNWALVRTEQKRRPVTCVQAYGDLSPAVRDLSGRYSHIIIDCGGRDSRELRSALTVANVLLAPVRPSQLDLWAVRNLAELVAEVRTFNRGLRALTVLSMVSTNVRIREAENARAWMGRELADFHLLNVELHDRKAYRDAIIGGASVLEGDDYKAAAEVAELGKELYGAQKARATKAA